MKLTPLTSKRNSKTLSVISFCHLIVCIPRCSHRREINHRGKYHPVLSIIIHLSLLLNVAFASNHWQQKGNYDSYYDIENMCIFGRMASSGMLHRVALTRATRRNIPEDAILHSHRRETLSFTCLYPHYEITVMLWFFYVFSVHVL
jgi:hypothetical protein